MTSDKNLLRRDGVTAVHSVDRFVLSVPQLAQARHVWQHRLHHVVLARAGWPNQNEEHAALCCRRFHRILVAVCTDAG